MILQNLILITAGLALLALAINWLYFFLLTRKVISRGLYFDYQGFYDAMKIYMLRKGKISLSEIQMRQDCTEKEALVLVRKYIKDGFLASKKNGENYKIVDNKANYDFRYDFIKNAASSSRSISHSDIKDRLSCNDDIADRILIDLENDGIIGPVDFVENRLNESEREVLVYNVLFKDDKDDEDYVSAKEYILATGKASTSALQTAFRWGYNKSARIINDLESEGVIGPVRDGERYREVLVKDSDNHIDEETVGKA